MSGCRVDEVEAYVFGELGAARAARVRAHIDGCPRCAGALADLREERALFAARARSIEEGEAPPNFAEVLRRSRGERPRPWMRRAAPLGITLAAAAALVLFFATSGDDDQRSASLPTRAAPSAAMCEDAPHELCCDDGEPVSVQESVHAIDRAIGHMEDEYGACLLVTPSEGPTCATSEN